MTGDPARRSDASVPFTLTAATRDEMLLPAREITAKGFAAPAPARLAELYVAAGRAAARGARGCGLAGKFSWINVIRWLAGRYMSKASLSL